MLEDLEWNIEELFLDYVKKELQQRNKEYALNYFEAFVPFVTYNTIKDALENKDLASKMLETLDDIFDPEKSSPLTQITLHEQLAYLLLLQPRPELNLDTHLLLNSAGESFSDLMVTAETGEDLEFFTQIIKNLTRRYAFFSENQELTRDVLKAAHEIFKKEAVQEAYILFQRKSHPFEEN